MRRVLYVVTALATAGLGTAPALSEQRRENIPQDCQPRSVTTYRASEISAELSFNPAKCPPGLVYSEFTITRCDQVSGACSVLVQVKNKCMSRRESTCKIETSTPHPQPEMATYTQHLELRTKTMTYTWLGGDREQDCVAASPVGGACLPFV